MNLDWINALMGGALIGGAVSIMLLFNGRVTGVSGILNGLLSPAKNDFLWRFAFIAGLFAGGMLLRQFHAGAFVNSYHVSTELLVLAGLLVGFGTILGSGCTSGHGVCGISRLSPRSLLATMTFIAAGILTIYILRLIGVII